MGRSNETGEAAVEIVEYDPVWPGKFDAERLLLENILKPWLTGAIEHVGSTAIAGMPAKPVIDIMAPVQNLEAARIAGRWSTDNRGTDIQINGTSTVQSSTSHEAWTSFQITSGFVAGTNRLTFVVNNGAPGAPQGSDPTGLRVEMWGTASPDCAFARPAPRMTIARQGGNIVLGWNQPGFMLQGAPDITGPWVDVTRGMSANGRDFTASVSSSGQRRFFQLRSDCP